MKDILARLESFDMSHGWDRYNRVENDTERLVFLQDEILHILGELGELANEVKKQKRKGVYDKSPLEEEATDVFIFLLKLMKTLDMEPKESFMRKMDINDIRFIDFKNKK